MYNQTPFGVRRAHSFDSYDNLERWQAIREHRMQYLSTRAKFEKTPPSEPPPPPPRHASKFKIITPSPSSAVSQLIQNFNEEMKNKNTLDRGNYSSTSQEQDRLYMPETKNISVPTDVTDRSNAYDSLRTNRFQNDNDHGKFRALESPGSVLKLTQSWQKNKESPSDGIIILKSSHQLIPAAVAEEKKQRLEVANEAPVIKKRVDILRYEEPTFFKDISISTTVLPTSINSTTPGVYIPPTLNSDSVDTRRERTTFLPSEIKVSSFKRSPGSKPTGYLSKEQNTYVQNSFNRSVSKNDVHQRIPFHKIDRKPRYNTQEDRRIYLESTLKMFADGLPEQGSNDNSGSSSVYSSDLLSIKPRRISTGSLHEPTVWRSQPPVSPARTLVQKYSSAEAKSNHKL